MQPPLRAMDELPRVPMPRSRRLMEQRDAERLQKALSDLFKHQLTVSKSGEQPVRACHT